MCSVTLQCGHDLILVRQNQRWCSRACRQRGYRDRQGQRQQAALDQAAKDRALEPRMLASARAEAKLDELRTHLLNLRKSGMVQHPINSMLPALNEALALLRASVPAGLK